jgi:TPR repeat protein
VAQDFVLAVEWYDKAGAQGCVKSSYQLGEMYFYGKGVEQDLERAVAAYRRAAVEGRGGLRAVEGEEGGHPPAQFSLGRCYELGQGVEQDDVQARAWYMKGALRGDKDAASCAGVMWLDGKGGERDYKYAAQMFRQAAEAGDGKGQNNLGKM